MVSSEHGNDFNCEVYSNLESLLSNLPEKYLVLIDIPIGLPKKESRLCDRLAREKLGPRRSSVFTVPCRESVYAKNYKEACHTNLRFLEKKISIQAWNICPKIRETDLLLQKHPELAEQWLEAHPELAFQALNHGIPLSYPKKKPEGFLERLNLLKNFHKYIKRWFQQNRNIISSQSAASDDFLDAFALCLAASGIPDEIDFLPAEPINDEKGLPMQICHPRF